MVVVVTIAETPRLGHDLSGREQSTEMRDEFKHTMGDFGSPSILSAPFTQPHRLTHTFRHRRMLPLLCRWKRAGLCSNQRF